LPERLRAIVRGRFAWPCRTSKKAKRDQGLKAFIPLRQRLDRVEVDRPWTGSTSIRLRPLPGSFIPASASLVAACRAHSIAVLKSVAGKQDDAVSGIQAFFHHIEV
jgi:hypothetical protein